jgi:hypothetical protein
VIKQDRRSTTLDDSSAGGTNRAIRQGARSTADEKGRPLTCGVVVVELRGFEPLTPCMPSRNPGKSASTKPRITSHHTEGVVGTRGVPCGIVRLAGKTNTSRLGASPPWQLPVECLSGSRRIRDDGHHHGPRPHTNGQEASSDRPVLPGGRVLGGTE